MHFDLKNTPTHGRRREIEQRSLAIHVYMIVAICIRAMLEISVQIGDTDETPHVSVHTMHRRPFVLMRASRTASAITRRPDARHARVRQMKSNMAFEHHYFSFSDRIQHPFCSQIFL
jgi:hypothetical protein